AGLRPVSCGWAVGSPSTAVLTRRRRWPFPSRRRSSPTSVAESAGRRRRSPGSGVVQGLTGGSTRTPCVCPARAVPASPGRSPDARGRERTGPTPGLAAVPATPCPGFCGLFRTARNPATPGEPGAVHVRCTAWRGSRSFGAGPTSPRDVPDGGPQARRPASPQARWRRTAAHCRTHARAEPLSAGPPPWERSADRAAPERPGTHTSPPRPRPGTRFKDNLKESRCTGLGLRQPVQEGTRHGGDRGYERRFPRNGRGPLQHDPRGTDGKGQGHHRHSGERPGRTRRSAQLCDGARTDLGRRRGPGLPAAHGGLGHPCDEAAGGTPRYRTGPAEYRRQLRAGRARESHEPEQHQSPSGSPFLTDTASAENEKKIPVRGGTDMPDIEGSNIHVGRELEAAGPYLNGQAQHIMGELHALKSRLQVLIDTWNAQSATDYQIRMHEWDMAAVGL